MMVVSKHNPLKTSPLFEEINLERLKRCAETAESAKQTIATSQRLTEESSDLIKNLKLERRKIVSGHSS